MVFVMLIRWRCIFRQHVVYILLCLCILFGLFTGNRVKTLGERLHDILDDEVDLVLLGF